MGKGFKNSWCSADPLLRGDAAGGVAVPKPRAKVSVVEHVLYLGGRGRETPFSSTSESEQVAEHFSAVDGCVWETTVGEARGAGAEHLPRLQLLQDLRGLGRGRCKWHDAFEVAQAARYVEQWAEHLLDWSRHEVKTLAADVRRTFRNRR